MPVAETLGLPLGLRLLLLLLLVRLRLLCRLLSLSGWFRAEGLPPWAALAARGSVDESLCFGIMRRSSRRSNDDVFEDRVEVIGEMVTTRVNIYGGAKGFDV